MSTSITRRRSSPLKLPLIALLSIAAVFTAPIGAVNPRKLDDIKCTPSCTQSPPPPSPPALPPPPPALPPPPPAEPPPSPPAPKKPPPSSQNCPPPPPGSSSQSPPYIYIPVPPAADLYPIEPFSSGSLRSLAVGWPAMVLSGVLMALWAAW